MMMTTTRTTEKRRESMMMTTRTAEKRRESMTTMTAERKDGVVRRPGWPATKNMAYFF